MKKTIDAKKEKFFFDRLKDLFEEWQRKEKSEGRRGSQQAFADQINEGKSDGRCDYRYVSKWLNGKAYPETYINDIARVLDVDVEELFPQTHDELYKDSSEYMNALKEEEITPYCDKIGLDEEFVKAIREQVDFDKSFPLFKPIHQNPNYIFDGKYYALVPDNCLSDSAPMDDDVFQIKRCVDEEEGSERLITLSRPDLLFLRDVQKEVSRYIEFLFMKRQEEMKDEVEMFNKTSEKRLTNGGITHVRLTEKQVREIAPYYKAFEVEDETK